MPGEPYLETLPIPHAAEFAERSGNRPVALCLTGLARGGEEIHVLNLARGLKHTASLPVRVFCHFDDWFAAQARDAGLDVSIIPLKGPAGIGSFAPFLKLTREIGCSLLHIHDKRAALAARHAASRLGLPVVSTHHGWIPAGAWVRFTDWLDLRMIGSREHCIAVSPAIAENLARHGMPPERIHAIPNSVDTKRFSEPSDPASVYEETGFHAGNAIIGFFGRLSPEKGPDRLINAFARLSNRFPQARLLFVGDGPLRAELERKVQDMSLQESVRILGFRTDAPRLMRVCSLLAITSRSEGTPQSVLEAMWLGIPVVGFDVGGIGSLVTHEQEGLLCKANDQQGLAENLGRILEDSGLRMRLGAGAKQRAQRDFRPEAMLERTLAVYSRAIQDCRKRAKPALLH